MGFHFMQIAIVPIGARMALWGAREFAGLILASVVAGLATTPYAAHHFHRLAPYGVIANLLAMPVVSVVVMPMGILGLLAMPFGFDAVFWRLMGDGIDWMIGVSLWVSNLPGAVGRIQAFGAGPLLLGTAGLLLICLLRTPLRWSGVILTIAAGTWAVLTPRPDVLVAGDGQAAAFRGQNGQLSVLHSARDSFAIKEWLAADADVRLPKDSSLTNGVTCDAIGCIGKFGDGRLVSMAFGLEAFAEDCMRAAVVVSVRETAAPNCAAILIERFGVRVGRWRCVGRAIDLSKPSRFRRNTIDRGVAALSVQRRPRNLWHRQLMRRRDRKPWKPRTNIAGKDRRACPEFAHDWVAEFELRRPYWPAQARSRRRGGGSA
jgi:hypothetical protein